MAHTESELCSHCGWQKYTLRHSDPLWCDRTPSRTAKPRDVIYSIILFAINYVLMLAFSYPARLCGATLGGNCTPIGASANIAGIGILRKECYEVKTKDVIRIGIPFTLAAVIPAYIYFWVMFS